MYIIVIMDGNEVDANTRRFYFFVGRATPPHSGHIQVIQETIKLARAGRTRALILLGDGPAGGLRTSKNPIEHDTKVAFIRHKLGMLREDPSNYVILKKDDRPVDQVVGFVSNGIPENVTEISIYQVAGDKDDDATKLEWILPRSCERLKQLLHSRQRQIQISNGGVTSIPPERTSEAENAMSATFVRETAVACYDSAGNDMDTAFTEWLKAFPFYSEYESSRLSKTMFEQIIKYKDITSEKNVIKAADGFLKKSNYNIDDAITLFLDRFTCYKEHAPTRLLLINWFEDIIASRTKSVATSEKRYVTTPSANSEAGSAERPKKPKQSGGSRRKHTRRRASNLRIKKTLRTNRRHNKHRHTRRRN